MSITHRKKIQQALWILNHQLNFQSVVQGSGSSSVSGPTGYSPWSPGLSLSSQMCMPGPSPAVTGLSKNSEGGGFLSPWLKLRVVPYQIPLYSSGFRGPLYLLPGLNFGGADLVRSRGPIAPISSPLTPPLILMCNDFAAA